MIDLRLPTRTVLLALLTSAALSQTAPVAPPPHRKPKPVQPQFDPNLILLDPAHGGPDSGSRLGPNLQEKDVNLAFARRLQSLLQSKGFTVQLTRESDQPAPPPPSSTDPTQPAPPAQPPPQVTLDQRAEQANRLRPAACLILHSSNSGHGVHLYTSSLTPPSAYGEPRQIQLWDTAQATVLADSTRLSTDLSQALLAQSLPLLLGRAGMEPLDSMSCPAVLIELSPLPTKSDQPPSVADQPYQARIAEALASGLQLWRSHAQAQLAAQAAATAKAAPLPTDKPAPKPKPKPKPPVPIIRSPPEPEPPPGAAQ